MTEPQGIPLAPAPTITTEDGRTIVAFHARCLGCGYDLHGLYVDAPCPECAQPVSRSLMGNLYRYCATDFVARVRLGALIAFLGLLSIVPLLIVIAILSGIFSNVGITGAAADIPLQFLGIFSYLAILTGWWFMSTPDPALDPAADPRSRRFLRLTIIIAGCSVLVDPLSFLLNISITGMIASSFLNVIIMGALVLGQIAKLLQWFAAMSFVRTMSTRLESPDIARFARFLWWAPIITLGVVALAIGIPMLLLSLGRSSTAEAGIVGACFSFILVAVMIIVVYVVYAVLLGRMHHHLDCALAAARSRPDQPRTR